MDRLFKSFSQVDASTTRKYGGTGLGLTIIKKLSEMMGGKMWVESEEGKGSTFQFTIKAEAVETSKKDYLEDSSLLLKEKNVLIVDDNATNRKLVTLQVEYCGMKPLAAASGREALGLLKKGKKFDLAIINMQMLKMDGLEATRKICGKWPKEKRPRIIAMTANEMKGDREMCLDAGMDDYISKPIKVEDLLESLCKCIKD